MIDTHAGDVKNILKLEFTAQDFDKPITIRDFLITLLETLWEEKEQFSSKRPWGNSDWEEDVRICLVKNNVIEGTLDDDGYLDEMNVVQYVNVMRNIFAYLKQN